MILAEIGGEPLTNLYFSVTVCPRANIAKLQRKRFKTSKVRVVFVLGTCFDIFLAKLLSRSFGE